MFEQWLQAKGFDAAVLTDQQKASWLAIYQKETAAANAPPPAPTPGTPAPAASAPANSFDDTIRAIETENTRIEYIRAATLATMQRHTGDSEKCRQIQELGTAAIADKTDARAFDLALIRADRDSGPIIMSQHRTQVTDEVLECAVLSAAGFPKVEKHFKAETLEAAHKSFPHIGLQQLFMMSAIKRGYAGSAGARIHSGNIREVMRYAFDFQPSASAASTISLPNILAAVANKEILAGFTEGDETWKELSQIKSVSNFHAHASYRMLDDMEYEELAPDGQIKHGAIGEESFSRQVKTYAKMFALTRTDILNDDMGAFDDLRTRLGRGAFKKFNNLWWTVFMDNSAFFTAARGNYIDGATTTLLADGVGLQQGITAFRKMKSATADGSKRIGGRPSILLVPPELEFASDRLYQSTMVNTGGAATTETIGNANIHAGKYRPVVEDRLSDSAFTGYSATAWYLFRNPSDMAPIVVSFLNGQQAPTIDSAEADFDQLGVQFRGFHDFGVDKAEWLAGVKVKGAAA